MITLHNITAGYPQKPVFENYSLTLPERGVVSIAGPSGTGKTTLLRLLCGLITPTAGTISGLNGLRISYVFQEDRLLPWRTTLENVMLVFGEETAENEHVAREWLKNMELEDVINEYPAALSGGMLRRVALARAAAYRGDVLLLDEPFTGLDIALRERVAAHLVHAAPLIIMVTHEMDDARAMGAEVIPLRPGR